MHCWDCFKKLLTGADARLSGGVHRCLKCHEIKESKNVQPK